MKTPLTDCVRFAQSVGPCNGKGGLASAGSLFPLEDVTRVTPEAVAALLSQYPQIPPRVAVLLILAAMCDGSFSPRKVCQCGCGATVTGKARLASAACRKRVQRERDALKTGSPKQFGFPLQHEIPVPIPTVTPPAASAEIFTPLPPHPEHREAEHAAALRNARVDRDMELAESWAKIAREDFAAGRPFSITPEPRFKHVAEIAVQIAFGQQPATPAAKEPELL